MKDKIIKLSSKNILCDRGQDFKLNGQVYIIDSPISKEKLEKLIDNEGIDYFSIESTCFIYAKDYFKIISQIREICHKLGKEKEIIVKLKGRKTLLENFNKNQNEHIHFKKDQVVKITNCNIQKTEGKTLIINSKQFGKLAKSNEKIIVDENLSSFTILEINEPESIKRINNKKSKYITHNYEILCKVDEDCTLNKHSFLMLPHADYNSHGIDLLSQREVAEIDYLDTQKIDFIDLSITNIQDLKSIKDILHENSNLKIKATIYDNSVYNINKFSEKFQNYLIVNL